MALNPVPTPFAFLPQLPLFASPLISSCPAVRNPSGRLISRQSNVTQCENPGYDRCQPWTNAFVCCPTGGYCCFANANNRETIRFTGCCASGFKCSVNGEYCIDPAVPVVSPSSTQPVEPSKSTRVRSASSVRASTTRTTSFDDPTPAPTPANDPNISQLRSCGACEQNTCNFIAWSNQPDQDHTIFIPESTLENCNGSGPALSKTIVMNVTFQEAWASQVSGDGVGGPGIRWDERLRITRDNNTSTAPWSSSNGITASVNISMEVPNGYKSVILADVTHKTVFGQIQLPNNGAVSVASNQPVAVKSFEQVIVPCRADITSYTNSNIQRC